MQRLYTATITLLETILPCLFKFDLHERKWLVQLDPIDYFDLGVFAESLNDELIYMDAALILKDNEFINRA